jgi:Bacterial antitoxin of type II TA system, VapB
MRTTIDLEDGLLRDARQAALESGRTLSAIVGEALREVLARRRLSAFTPIELPAHRALGGADILQPGIDITDNAAIRALLDDPRVADRRQRPRP